MYFRRISKGTSVVGHPAGTNLENRKNRGDSAHLYVPAADSREHGSFPTLSDFKTAAQKPETQVSPRCALTFSDSDLTSPGKHGLCVSHLRMQALAVVQTSSCTETGFQVRLNINPLWLPSTHKENEWEAKGA